MLDRCRVRARQVSDRWQGALPAPAGTASGSRCAHVGPPEFTGIGSGGGRSEFSSALA
jgi:hypothetical protein